MNTNPLLIAEGHMEGEERSSVLNYLWVLLNLGQLKITLLSLCLNNYLRCHAELSPIECFAIKIHYFFLSNTFVTKNTETMNYFTKGSYPLT